MAACARAFPNCRKINMEMETFSRLTDVPSLFDPVGGQWDGHCTVNFFLSWPSNVENVK
jgi:hypothetical protein